MAGSLDKLMLTIGLLDKITGPMRGIQKTIQQVTSTSRKAFMNTAAGVAALVAASSSFANTINPANDMNMALGEVRSLEVADSTLAALNQAGLKYSIEFGDQASNYVRSAYDIQSAIDGLVNNDLPRFTTAAGTLAKATKANVTDITEYFGTMFGIFKNQANEMGKGTWVEMLAGQTAKAVQMFKTTGPEMSAAFGSIGADATTMGVKLNEQMAVLGTLQATMSGAEAGTKYGAFLEGLSGAQDKLGLQFTDDSGQLLPIVEILDMIKGKTDGLNALEMQDVLSNAFGSGEAVGFIKLMSNDVSKLAGDIDALGDIKGMDKATWMAKQMQNNFARLSQAVTAVSIAIWQKALPAIEPFINKITDAAAVVVEWADKYPHLTKYVGLAATAFIAFVAVAGAVTLAIGLMQYASVGLMMRFVLIKPVVWGVRLAVLSLKVAFTVLRVTALLLYGSSILIGFGLTALKAGFLSSLPAIWAFNAALLANPITWIILGIVALVAAIVGLIVYWDKVTEAIGKGWNWLKGLFSREALTPRFDYSFGVFDKIKQSWQSFKDWIGGLSLAPVWNLGGDLTQSLVQKWGEFQVWLGGVLLMPSWDLKLEIFDTIRRAWIDLKKWISGIDIFAALGDGADWIISKLNLIPGINIETETNSTQDIVKRVEEQGKAASEMVSLPGSESAQSGGESGGLFQTISNMFGGDKKSLHVEKMEVNNNGKGVRGDDLLYELEMSAG